MIKKPTVEEILTIKEECIKKYDDLWKKFEEDERWYELDFKDFLNIPVEFHNDRVVLPTARDVVDVAVNHTDIINARVFANKKSTSETSKAEAEMLRKLGLGIIHATNVESQIAPGHVTAKHFWIHGLSVIKSVWDADNWVNKPLMKEDESQETYAARIKEWRADTHLTLPIMIEAVNPANIMPDPFTGGKLYAMERHKKLVYDAMLQYPQWKNPKSRNIYEEIDYLDYWDKHYRCTLLDDEPIIKVRGGVAKHNYGFIPYTLIESGLGNLSKDAAPEKRYVGLLRYIIDLLVSQSTNYTLCDILMKKETMKGGWVSGEDAESLGEIKQAYGKYWPVGNKNIEFHDWESKLAPEAAYAHLALTSDFIAGHAAPRSVRGLSEEGVRSGADRRLVMAEAAAIYRYSSPAFANGWAKVLEKCALLVKNVIPDSFDIYGRTPNLTTFSVTVKKNLLKEPFNYWVEFAPISEEDEYRRHDDLMRRMDAGIIDREYAWQRQSDVDPEEMKKRTEKEVLRSMPMYLQTKDQHMANMFQQAAVEAGVPVAPPAGGGEAAPEGQGGQLGRRGNVPPIPNRVQPGSLQDITKRPPQTPIRPNQGRGGGGNRG